MRRIASLAALLLLAQSSVALAQRSLANTAEAVVEGPGHMIGESTVFHPRAALQTGFISNVFYEATSPVAAGVARLNFGFGLANEGQKPKGIVADAEAEEDAESETPKVPPDLAFRAAGNFYYERYLSDKSNVTDQSNFAGTALIDAILKPQGTTSLVFSDLFTRATSPPNFEASQMLNQDINQLMVGVNYQPGGRALKLGLRYENMIDVFESEQSDFANRMNQLIGVRAGWQFLPITRFTFDGSLGFFGGLGSGAIKNSSTPLRLQLGVATALTELTTLRGNIGFGKGFYSAGQDFTNILFGAELGFRYSPMGRVRVAYSYDFRDSLQANFFRDHAVIVKLDQQLGRVVVGGDAQARLRGYRGIPMQIGPASRDDLILSLAAAGHYLYREWFAISGNLRAVSDTTDYMPAVADDPSYNRIELTAGVTAAF